MRMLRSDAALLALIGVFRDPATGVAGLPPSVLPRGGVETEDCEIPSNDLAGKSEVEPIFHPPQQI